MAENLKTCSHIECEDNTQGHGWPYCKYHMKGGVLGDGSLFDQYEIIESDFLDFIKVVPIDEEKHLDVYSPILRDIILRTCTQIEVFFKEWAKYRISEDKELDLFKKYNRKSKGERNWTFGDYFIFKEVFRDYRKVYVRPINSSISPFESWESSKILPIWWNAYNSIKHSGTKAKYESTLRNCLYSIAALFHLHVSNNYSRSFIKEFSWSRIEIRNRRVLAWYENISTPIDSKRYLFKEDEGLLNPKRYEDLLTKDEWKRLKNKKRL